MLLSDVNVDEIYKIIINICMDIKKNMFRLRKDCENMKYPETVQLWW